MRSCMNRAYSSVTGSGKSLIGKVSENGLGGTGKPVSADQLLLLGNGGVQAFGTPQQVLQPPVLHQVFGLDVLVQPHPEQGRPLVIAR